VRHNLKTIVKEEGFEEFLETTGLSVEAAAEVLGDSPLRLYRVLEGLEPFGLTATLAAHALTHGLPAIRPGD